MRGPADDVVRLSVSGDPERCHAYVPLALALLRRTQDRMHVGGLAQLAAQQRFAPDAYCYVRIAGGISAVHIVAGYGPEATQPVDLTPVEIPDFLSGVVRNGYVEEVPADPPTPAYKTLADFHPTLSCADRFDLAKNYQRVRRLAVMPSDALAGDLSNPNENSPLVFSQYTRLRPTMYSGTMRHLVQVLMGFGKPRRAGGVAHSIYDREESSIKQPGAKKRTPTAQDLRIANDGLQIVFDWHFSRTHGITYGADGTPWLVEVGITQGVIAVPLALRPETKTAAFRKRLEDHGDTEALEILDRYGGFPTGEGFPPTDQLEAWIRAGRVLRLVEHDDMAPFYDDHSSYSPEMGWAFNLRGDEVHNTAWRYGDDDVQRGVHYMLPIHIAAITTVDAQPGMEELRSAFSKLHGDSYKDTLPAALWKIRRLSAFQVKWAMAALNRRVEEAFQYVDSLELDPMAPASSHLVKVSEGTLWYPPNAKIENGTIIRFPDPALGYLVAHSMKPASARAPMPALCNTTMHVFFAGNELKWVKFYRDNTAGAGPANTNENEPCMFIGQWAQHSDGGNRAVPAMFYTNDLDDREELAPSTTDVKQTGTDMGYSSIAMNDDLLDPSQGRASRTKRFRMKTETVTVFSPSLGTGVAVPFYEREAYYYAVFRGHQGKQRTVSYGYKYLTDPWYCFYKRNFPGYYGQYRDTYDRFGNFTGYVPVRLNDVNGYGPNEFRTANPDSPRYDNSNACADIADTGPWMKGGDNLDAMQFSIPEQPQPAPVNEYTPPGGSYDVWLVCSNDVGAIRAATVGTGSFNLWPLWTPDLSDGFSADQYIEATQNVAGVADSIRFGTNLNAGLRLFGVPDWPGMESGRLTYIGVING